MNTLQRTIWIGAALLAAVGPRGARAATDIDISAYYTDTWADPTGGPGGSNSEYNNGAQIAAAPTNGNTGTGITFAAWNGHYVETGPDIGIASRTLTLGSVLLPSNPTVNALFSTFYGVSGSVDGTVEFENHLGMTATFSLVGNQTIRDYNQNIYTNDLQGYNTNPSYGTVTTQNWWNNVGFPANGQGDQRLDVETFVLPAIWAGTEVTSVTLTDPFTTATTNDLALSAMQVAPEPTAFWLLVVGLVGFGLARSFTRRTDCP